MLCSRYTVTFYRVKEVFPIVFRFLQTFHKKEIKNYIAVMENVEMEFI